jgi:tRNA(adenine34) deaminase
MDEGGTPQQAPGSRSSFRGVREEDEAWMRLALAEAAAAAEAGEVPVGAVLVGPEGEVARGRNRIRDGADPIGHAEILTLRAAALATGDARLVEHTLYVTLEPCAMCAGAIVLSRVRRVVFGAYDPKAGMCGSLENLVQDPRLNHRVELLGGVLAEECGEMLRRFFRERRMKSEE